MATQVFDIAKARDAFPSLNQNQVFGDNAGGSQTLGSVAESIRDYLFKTNVQLGASYATGQQSNKLYEDGYVAAAKFINAARSEIVLGSSTTQLFRNLSFALSFQPGDEMVLSKLDHEANIASWVSLAERFGLLIKWWAPEAPNPKLTPDSLAPLLTQKTRLVACTHVSNLLGSIHDIKGIGRLVHAIPGALLCVDAVAYAPHRRIDVKDFGIDIYAFSWYKVYGPHMALLYVRDEIHSSQVKPLSHFFNPTSTLEQKLALAGSSYELVQSIPAILSYFGPDPDRSFEAIAEHERGLQTPLLAYLAGNERVTLFGEPDPDPRWRVPTISFVVKDRGSKDVVLEVEKRSNFGIRWGHFYAKRLCDDVLKLGPEGVVRISLVHYNTVEEVERLIEILREVIG